MGGQEFTHFAKGRYWGKELYADLVAPSLKSDLATETWQNGAFDNVVPTFCPPDYDYTTLTESKWAADDAYAQAGVTDPKAEIAMAEVHDCFTPTELVLMEDLGFSDAGGAWQTCSTAPSNSTAGSRSTPTVA